MPTRSLPALLTALLMTVSPSAQAQTLSDILSAELLPGWKTATGTHMAAIRLTLSQGWKTYWRSPGDAGIPPEFDWRGSDNVKAVHLHWPTPEVFSFNGMQTIGYARELVLPVEVWPKDADRAVRLETAVDLGVCRDICVPASLTLSADLRAPGQSDDAAIRSALKARPATPAEAGVRGHHCDMTPAAEGLTLRATIDLPPVGPDEVVVIETADSSVWVAEPVTHRNGRLLVAHTDLVARDRQPFAMSRSDITITVLGGGRAVEISGCPAP